MNNDQVKTKNRKFFCMECENEIEVMKDKEKGDFFECEFCGIEFEILEKYDDGEYKVQIVEEEK